MRRKIKFRSWYKEKKEMLYLRQVYSFADSNYSDNMELMQYIGLEDKNGKAVYEDDVVQRVGSNERVVIQFTDGIAKGCDPFVEVAGGGWQSADFDEVEVIGNIWANPELGPRVSR